ncbi:MAG: hypothetical protein VKP72_10105 [bacterium]|nr:hypothetical protein [bacterium]
MCRRTSVESLASPSRGTARTSDSIRPESVTSQTSPGDFPRNRMAKRPGCSRGRVSTRPKPRSRAQSPLSKVSSSPPTRAHAGPHIQVSSSAEPHHPHARGIVASRFRYGPAASMPCQGRRSIVGMDGST